MNEIIEHFSSDQSLSCVQLFATPWTSARQASQSITNSRSLLKLISIESVMPSNHLILCCPLPLLPSVFPSIRVFSNEPVLHIRWPKYWSFSISTSNEYSGLISLGLTGWISLLSKGLSSLLQHHISKASLLWRLGFFIVQLSRPYVTTGKSIALTRWTFVGKVMSLFLICCLGWSWQPTPVFLPGKPHEQRSLVDYSPWDCKESDTTERLHFHFY